MKWASMGPLFNVKISTGVPSGVLPNVCFETWAGKLTAVVIIASTSTRARSLIRANLRLILYRLGPVAGPKPNVRNRRIIPDSQGFVNAYFVLQCALVDFFC